jgi:DNA-binding transcriptional ArsR family regulator
MAGFRRNRNRRKTDTTAALRHPLRLRILEVTARERGRSLSVEALTTALIRTPGFENVTPSQINYHRTRLQAAELLPGTASG